MTWKIFIDMAASFWFFSSFLAKSISFYFRNQIYTALGFQKYSHCNKVLYISPWTIPFYTSDVSLLTKKSLIFAIFYKCESGVLLKYAPQSGRGTRNAKKPLNGFQGCHENALNESCEMSPHLMCLGWHPRFLLWPASGSGLESGHKRE